MRRLRHATPLESPALERALVQLRAVVQARGLHSTPMGELVARATLQLEGHFTLDDLIRKLRAGDIGEAGPSAAPGMLPLLIDAGLIQVALVASGGAPRYERAFEREHHDHLVCTSCGSVIELQSEALDILRRDLAERLGFHITGHLHEIRGRCKRC